MLQLFLDLVKLQKCEFRRLHHFVQLSLFAGQALLQPRNLEFKPVTQDLQFLFMSTQLGSIGQPEPLQFPILHLQLLLLLCSG